MSKVIDLHLYRMTGKVVDYEGPVVFTGVDVETTHEDFIEALALLEECLEPPPEECFKPIRTALQNLEEDYDQSEGGAVWRWLTEDL